jgi:hypothetical protein
VLLRQERDSIWEGVYFAVDASYSIDDTYSRLDSQGNKCMYLARVVVGDCCVGNDTMTLEGASPADRNFKPLAV